MSSTILFITSNFQFWIAIIFAASFFASSHCRNMEAGFLQDLAFTVSLTIIVYFILSKLLSNFAEDVTNATCNSRTDGFIDKAGFLELIRKKYPGILDLGKERNLGSSGLQVVVSEVGDDHEGKELNKEEKFGKDNNNNEVLGGVVEEVLVQELKGEKDCVGVCVGVRVGGSGGGGGGGGEVIKEKVVDKCSESRPIPQEIKEEQESPVEETPVVLREEFEVREGKNEGICEVLEDEDSKEIDTDAAQNTENREGNESNDQVVEESEEGLFDDWEGIERSELEKRLDAAVAFVGSKSNADHIDRNLKMQLYGLHRVAREGRCHRPQPLALKFSARAKWNAWQKLGNMSGDMAMEQYLALLSKSIPAWEDKQ